MRDFTVRKIAKVRGAGYPACGAASVPNVSNGAALPQTRSADLGHSGHCFVGAAHDSDKGRAQSCREAPSHKDRAHRQREDKPNPLKRGRLTSDSKAGREMDEYTEFGPGWDSEQADLQGAGCRQKVTGPSAPNEVEAKLRGGLRSRAISSSNRMRGLGTRWQKKRDHKHKACGNERC